MKCKRPPGGSGEGVGVVGASREPLGSDAANRKTPS